MRQRRKPGGESIKGAVWAEWRAEAEAHQRWVAAIEAARNFLVEGHITTEVLTDGGIFHDVPVTEWLSRKAVQFFATGFGNFRNPHGVHTFEIEGIILIDRKAVDSLWDEKAETARPAEVAAFDEAVFPYLAFLVKAAREMPLSPTKRTHKKTIEYWLRENWPQSLGQPTDYKIRSMATFLRRPEDEKGGIQRSSDAKASTH